MKENSCYTEKIDKRLFLCFTIWLIALGAALLDFNSHSIRLRSVTDSILPIVLIYFIRITRFKLSHIKPLLAGIGVIAVWQVLLIVKFGGYNILLGRLYDVIFAFIVIRALGLKRFFFYFETCTAKLCYISVILWLALTIVPPLRNLLIPYSLPINQTGTQVAHWGIVGISNSENLGLSRNLGFAWEPGRFSSIVVLALLAHLFRVRFQLFQKNFIPFFLGILTSLSTTGYMALAVCILGFYKNASKKFSAKVLKTILPTAFIAIVFASPFLWEKMLHVADSNYFLDDGAAKYYSTMDYGYVPQRAEGLYLDFLNIIDSPLVGFGDNTDYSYVRRVKFPGLRISLSDGVLQVIAMMGIPLALFFYIALYRSSQMFSRMYRIKGGYLFFLCVVAVNVSYDFFYDSIFICIVLYSLYLPTKDRLELSRIKSLDK